MLVSIVIATYNHASLLAMCFDALAKMENVANENFEIIIVDNKSTDNTKEITENFIKNNPHLKIHYIYEPQVGLSSARNAALKIAKGKYIAFIDDDALVDKQWLSEIFKTIKNNPEIAAFGGPVKAIALKPPIWMPLEIAGYNLGNKEKIINSNTNEPIGANMIIRKDLILKENGFNINLGVKGNKRGYGEDTEMFQRIIRQGLLIKYIPTVKVDHFINPNKLKLFWRYMRIMRVNSTCIKMAKNKTEMQKFITVTLSNSLFFLKKSIFYLFRDPLKSFFLISYTSFSLIALFYSVILKIVKNENFNS